MIQRFRGWISTMLVVVLVTTQPLFALGQNWDWRQYTEQAKRHKSRGVEMLDVVRKSVKTRQEALEDEARKDEFFYYGTKSTNPQIGGEVEVERQRLLAIVNNWSQAGEKEILAIKTDELNRVMTQATAIGYYHGLDVIKLTKLYELGKDVIAGTLFELPDNKHPDDSLMYEKFKRRYLDKQIEARRAQKGETMLEAASRGATAGTAGTPVAPIISGLEFVFNDFFKAASDREVEIAEFMAKKNEYRVLLFKRVTLAYLRALLASGEKLPFCTAETKTLTIQEINGRKFPVVGCPDPSLSHLRDYVNAIRTLQSAESDTFMAEARMVIAEQQLGVDAASVIPIVGDGLDWIALFYGLYAHEDFTGHCLTRLDYAINFMAAVLPEVTPRMIDSWLKRFPDGRMARFFVNMNELLEAATYANGRRVAVGVHSGLTDLTGQAVGKAADHSDIIADLAERWGVSRQDMENFAGTLRKWVDEVEDLEAKAAREAIEKAGREAEEQFMNDTFTAAVDDRTKQKRMKETAPEYVKKAIKEIEERVGKTLMSMQPDTAEEAFRMLGMPPGHGEAILKYLRMAEAGEIDELAPETMVLIYRGINPKAAKLIEEFGVHTKGMDVKGKSADWGVHEGFVPVDQNFSKLANPNKRVNGVLPAENAVDVQKYQNKMDTFYVEKGNEAHLYKVELVVGDKPVKIVKDVETGHEITVFYDPKTKQYLDKDMNPVKPGSIDISHERPLEVVAYPDKDGNPRPLTADFDLLAFGFSKDLEAPSYNDLTGFITPKEQKVVDGVNKTIQELTGYDGNVSHHGGEYYNPYTPGALEEDKVVGVYDRDFFDDRPLIVPRCDRPCMINWCKTSELCKRYGFPDKISICSDMTKPSSPCIPVDPNRLLKDYMYLKRIKSDIGLFPNKNWDWGDYNVLGGWTMIEFMDQSLTGVFAGELDDLGAKAGEALLARSGKVLTRKASEYLGGAFEYANECPYGKRASDLIEEGQ